MYQTHHIPLRRFFVCIVAGILLMLMSFTALARQSGERDANRQERSTRISSPGMSWTSTPTTSGTADGQGMIYIDQVGLQFLSSNSLRSDYADPATYVLGPQDVLSLTVKGSLSFSVRAAVINAGGSVSIPFAGDIYVSGMTLEDGKEKIRQVLAEEIVDFRLEVSLQQPKPVTVTVSGDIPNPGQFQYPAGTRLDVAFFESVRSETDTAGVNLYETKIEQLSDSDYSTRSILLHRSGSDTVSSTDLLTFYYTGNPEHNPYLYDGDRIRIIKKNEYTPRVSLSGAVQYPLETEYRKMETLADLLEMAGGKLAEADQAMVHRYRSSAEATGIGRTEINLEETDASSVLILPNDHFVVPFSSSASAPKEAFTVELRGQVERPGIYPVFYGTSSAGDASPGSEGQLNAGPENTGPGSEGQLRSATTSLSELLKLAGGLTDQALAHGAYIVRTFDERRRVPSVFQADSDRVLRTSDSFNEGFEYLSLEEELMDEYRIYIDLTDPSAMELFTLNDGDRLMIPRDDKVVIVYGQVNQPGTYAHHPGKTVEEYIRQAGGKTLAADADRIFIIKAAGKTWKKPGETTIESGDMIFADRVPYDDFYRYRDFELQTQTQRRANIQLILSTVTTVASIITTYFAIRGR